VVLEWPAPGMQDPREPREVRPDETCVFGELCEGFSRGVEHGVIREALLRAEKGTQGLRDSEGEEEVRPRELLVQRVLEPLVGLIPTTTSALDMLISLPYVASKDADSP